MRLPNFCSKIWNIFFVYQQKNFFYKRSILIKQFWLKIIEKNGVQSQSVFYIYIHLYTVYNSTWTDEGFLLITRLKTNESMLNVYIYAYAIFILFKQISKYIEFRTQKSPFDSLSHSNTIWREWEYMFLALVWVRTVLMQHKYFNTIPVCIMNLRPKDEQHFREFMAFF